MPEVCWAADCIHLRLAKPVNKSHIIHPKTTTATTSTSPALSDLQTQLHDTHPSLADHVEKVWPLEGIIAEHDAITLEVALLRQLMSWIRGGGCGYGCGCGIG